MRSLLCLRSQVAEQVIAYLRAVDIALAESPVIGLFQKQHAGFDLRLDRVRIDLKAETYDGELARREAPEGESLRPFWRPARSDREEDGRPGERLTLRRSERPLPAPAQPLTRLLSAEQPRPVRHAVILGNPGSGKSEALKHQVRLCAGQSCRALEAFKALPGMVALPVHLHGVRLTEKLGDTAKLDQCIAGFPALVRPPQGSEDDWRKALRAAAAMLLAEQDAFAAAAERHAAAELWRALTLPIGPPAMALVAIDGWDETRPDLQAKLREALRPFARVTAARVIVASRSASYAPQDNPLFDPPAVRPGHHAEQQELRLREFDLLDIRQFIDLFFGIVRSDGEPAPEGDGSEDATRRAIGEQLKQALARAPYLAGIVDNPLMSTLLCHDFWFDQQHERRGLPHSRGELFGRILRRMIGKWRLLRAGQPAAENWAPWAGPEAKTKQMLDLLTAIAESAFPGELMLAAELDDFLHRDMPDLAYQGYVRRLDGTDPLKRYVKDLQGSLADELCADGILMEVVGEKGRGFGFLHRQFMEYLVAHAWAKRINPPKDATGRPLGDSNWPTMADRIDRLAWDRDYCEVIVLLAGLLDDPGPMLELLTDRPKQDVLRSRLILAALCLPEIEPTIREHLRDLIAHITGGVINGAEREYWAADEQREPEFHRAAMRAVAIADQSLVVRQQEGLRRRDVHFIKGAGWFGTAAGTSEILDILTGLLHDDEETIQLTAVEAIGAIGAAAATSEILAALAELLRDGSGLLSWFVLETIARLGSAALTPDFLLNLNTMLREGNAIAARVIEILGAPATPEILGALSMQLRADNWNLRLAAAKAVDRLGVSAVIPEFGATIASLVALMRHKDPDTRKTGADSVGRLGAAADSPEILEALATSLHDDEEAVRFAAMGAVKNVGALVATREILAAITNWLQDDELEVRARAADAIGSLGTAAAKDEVLTAMIALLNYGVPDPDDRQSISRINDRFEFSNIRAITARAVGSLGAAAATPQIVTALAARLRDDVWTVWRDSAEAVGRLGAGAATPEILAELARELSHWPRSVTAGEALALMGSRAAGATLLSALPCLKRDDRVRAVYNVLTHWSDVRLFRLGDEWKLIPLDDLIQGRYPFIA